MSVELVFATPVVQLVFSDQVVQITQALDADTVRGTTPGTTGLGLLQQSTIAGARAYLDVPSERQAAATARALASAHETARDPHRQYTTVTRANWLARAQAVGAVAAHETARDPHRFVYPSTLRALALIRSSNPDIGHAQIADPHPRYTTLSRATLFAGFFGA